MKNLSKKGFTLVELLVVISIIGLLSTIAVVSLGSARTKARDAKRIADVKQISTSLEQYYADVGSYFANATSNGAATGLALGVAASTDSLTFTNGFAASPGAGTVYMGRVPPYPGTTAACTATAAYTPPTTYNTNYCYYTATASAATDYKLTVKLEATNPAAGISATNCLTSSSGMVCT